MKYLDRRRRSRPKCRLDSTRPLGHPDYVAQRDLKSPLARALKDRRAELGVTQEQFVARVPGMKIKTLQRAEGGSKPHPSTLGQLDEAAGWPRGWARQIRDGELTYPPSEPDPEQLAAQELREHLRLLKRRMPYAEFVRVVAEAMLQPQQADTESGPTSDLG